MNGTATGPARVVALISGEGSNLQAIIDACASGLPARVVAVISNVPAARGLDRARAAGIPAQVVDHRGYPDRADFDRALLAAIDEHRPDLVVLAGFMRILTPEFTAHYLGRMLNVHPSLLPDLKGLHTHQRALDEGRHEHGTSVHFVTVELDGGPVILQAGVPVLPSDDADSLALRVQSREHRIYPLVIGWFADGRLRLTEAGIELDGEPLGAPLRLEDLTGGERLASELVED